MQRKLNSWVRIKTELEPEPNNHYRTHDRGSDNGKAGIIREVSLYRGIWYYRVVVADGHQEWWWWEGWLEDLIHLPEDLFEI